MYRVAFTAQSSTAVLRFENDSPAGDRSIFIDDVSVAACIDCVPTIDLSTCVVGTWQPISTGLGADFTVTAPASKTGRDIRSGNPGDVTEVRLPNIASAQPIIRLRFNYQ